jgi:hypothetical protein
VEVNRCHDELPVVHGEERSGWLRTAAVNSEGEGLVVELSLGWQLMTRIVRLNRLLQIGVGENRY